MARTPRASSGCARCTRCCAPNCAAVAFAPRSCRRVRSTRALWDESRSRHAARLHAARARCFAPRAVAEAVRFVVSQPADVNVDELRLVAELSRPCFIPLVDMLRCVRARTTKPGSSRRSIVPTIATSSRARSGCPDVPGRVSDSRRASSTSPSDVSARRISSAESRRRRFALPRRSISPMPRMTAVLHGSWGAHAPARPRVFSPAQLLLVNPPVGITSGDGISIVVRRRCAAGASVDRRGGVRCARPSDAMFASLVASLRRGGRLLGPAAMPVPDGFTELARDEEVWVARWRGHRRARRSRCSALGAFASFG